MKSKILFFALLLVFFALTVKAQNPVYPQSNSNNQIPFGKKMPGPVLNARDQNIAKIYDKGMKRLPYTSFDTVAKKFITHAPGQEIPSYSINNTNGTGLIADNTKTNPSGFHLTKDINTSSDSYPANNPANSHYNFAVLNNVSYFFADDGINGRELWRSNGTPSGTYLLKDINPGAAGSNGDGIISANGLLFFSAQTNDNGIEPWVSDGTAGGTHLLMDINIGTDYSNPDQFVNANGSIFFCATPLFGVSNSQLWKTDGTTGGTTLVTDIQQSGIGYGIYELTAVNDLAYFVAYTYNSGYQLFRSDGTGTGTYVVKEIGFNYYDGIAPMQLTSYNNQLFFSADDGTGRKLWTSDGTFDGTGNAPGNNDILMQVDYVDIYNNRPFRTLNNVLYIAGYTDEDGGGLYKYNASDPGEVLVKDLTDDPDFTYDNVLDFVVAVDITVVNNILYFKVISNINGLHDELWSTDGTTGNTHLVKTIGPGDSGVYTYNYYNNNGTLYFVVNNDLAYGNELWKSDGTDAGTVMVKDIEPGKAGSYPDDLTFCNGKLLFRATNDNHGNELWSSDGTTSGTKLVKDINTVTTNGSDAGFFYKGIAQNGNNGVVFGAFTATLGGELYKSDGTNTGTKLLNDIADGPTWSYPNSFIFKNGVNYFIGDNLIGTSIYKTDGTKAGLQQIVYNIDRVVYYVTNFNVTDQGLPFYILANRNTGAYELWRSDGTQPGTYALSTNLYYNDYIVTVGNTVFFVAGDSDHGFELWKSDGTQAGTKMVKDINTGFNGSYPYSLFAFKKDIYFGAQDGGLNSSFWKSDGTTKGTIKLANITPASYDYSNNYGVQYFCISNNTLYFDATDFNEFGAELWKTDGTKAGTKLVKDINAINYPYSSYPSNLTDVNGTLYFIADNGINGTELWLSNGKPGNTKMVKDITPDPGGSTLANLCSAAGKLYFLKHDYIYTPNFSDNISIWSSDGSSGNTNQLSDPGLAGLSNISELTASGNKLFFGAYSSKYGDELYEGDATNPTLISFSSAKIIAPVAQLNPGKFDAILYPNPAHSEATLQIKGNATNVMVIITDMAGKVLWIKQDNHSPVRLPAEKLAAGVYTITVRSVSDSKTLRLVRE